MLVHWLVPLTACWLFASGCGPSDGELNSARRKAIEKLKHDWKLQTAQFIQEMKQEKFPRKGGSYPTQVTILVGLLNQTPTKVVEAEFQRICTVDVAGFSYEHPEELDRNYDSVLLEAFLKRSMERKDKEHLVTLLRHHCPQYVRYCALEFVLAYDWPQSIGWLFDCYATSDSPVAKKDMLACLRRAFPSLHQRFPADDEFVKHAQSWYAANHAKLQLNHMYKYVPAQPFRFAGEDTSNLFLYQPK